jgi:hypothetical protein
MDGYAHRYLESLISIDGVTGAPLQPFPATFCLLYKLRGFNLSP